MLWCLVVCQSFNPFLRMRALLRIRDIFKKKKKLDTWRAYFLIIGVIFLKEIRAEVRKKSKSAVIILVSLLWIRLEKHQYFIFEETRYSVHWLGRLTQCSLDHISALLGSYLWKLIKDFNACPPRIVVSWWDLISVLSINTWFTIINEHLGHSRFKSLLCIWYNLK